MTEQDAIDMLGEAERLARRDPEGAHSHADRVLCAFLREHGYGTIVDAWDAVSPKWYT